MSLIGGILLLGAISLYVVYPLIMDWRKQRILRSAQVFLDSQDYRRAHLLLEQFVAEYPQDRAAARLYAKTLEAIDTQAAADLWSKLTSDDAADFVDFIGAATVALRLGRWDDMQVNLAHLEKLQPNSVAYHRLAAARALALRDVADLRRNLEALTQLEPGNELTRFSLTTILLNSALPADREAARHTLENYARGDDLRIRAGLALIDDAPRRWPEEKTLAGQLIRLGRHLGADKSGSAGYGPNRLGGMGVVEDLIEHMKNQPEPNAADAVALAHWLMRHGRTREGLFWLDTLDGKTRRAPAVLTAMSACTVKLESWDKLEQLLHENAWGPVPGPVITLAFQAHEARRSRNEAKARSNWSRALELSDQSLPGLLLLQRLAQVWAWPDMRSQALWLVVKRNPREAWAWPVLAEQAMRTRDTIELWQVYNNWIRAVPDNLQARIERVLLGLLVRPATPGLVAQADALLQQYPDKPVCQVSQALALWREGRSREGLQVFESQLLDYNREPRFALVYALLLAQEGRTEKSRQIVAGLSADKFLPEEWQLIVTLQEK